MKTLINSLLVLILLSCYLNPVYSQPDTVNIPYHISHPGYKVYVGAGGGIPGNIYAGFTLIHPSNFGANIHYRYATFTNESSKGWFSPPPDELTILSFNFVREYLMRSPFVRIGLEAGLSYVVFTEKFNFVPNPIFFLIPIRTYSYEESVEQTAGLNFRVKLEVPFSLAFGLETSLIINLNPAQCFFGLDLGFTLGKVRDRRVMSPPKI